MYYFRLDDAADYLNVENWMKIEKILDKYNIQPLVGIIPMVEDKDLLAFGRDDDFWSKVEVWEKKGWEIALHGYNHVCTTEDGGLNPVNKRSEFAGVPYDIQKEKIVNGMKILKEKNIVPKVFFAPSHTFDYNTILALKDNTNIAIISDTIANDTYCKYGMTFVPQQSGCVRSLPFRKVTFCYHPNTMTDSDFEKLEVFLKKNNKKFKKFPTCMVERKESLYDRLLRKIYFFSRTQ